MPLQCRFDNPDAEINGEEYYQYIYAMRLWYLQDKMGLSFEVASMALGELRRHIPESILEFRSDMNLDDKDKLEAAEKQLIEETAPMKEKIYEWERKNNKRFIGVPSFTHWDSWHDRDEKWRLPEFCYYE